jgi:hypothetical protein
VRGKLGAADTAADHLPPRGTASWEAFLLQAPTAAAPTATAVPLRNIRRGRPLICWSTFGVRFGSHQSRASALCAVASLVIHPDRTTTTLRNHPSEVDAGLAIESRITTSLVVPGRY